jgi:hypothetical protein
MSQTDLELVVVLVSDLFPVHGLQQVNCHLMVYD